MAPSPLDNYLGLSDAYLVDAFRTSIEISAVTAIAGGIFGLLLAYSVILGGLPRDPAIALMTFSGVASNFAGVPLALAFAFTLGNLGLVTKLVFELTGFRLTRRVQPRDEARARDRVPVLPVPPHGADHRAGLDGLRQGLAGGGREPGATPLQYWRHVALPVLMPSILGGDRPAVRECLRRPGDGLPADWWPPEHRHAGHRAPRSAATCCTTRARVRGRDGDGRRHRDLDPVLQRPAAALRAMAARMTELESRTASASDRVLDPPRRRRARGAAGAVAPSWPG